jgi:hypothetical protein
VTLKRAPLLDVAVQFASASLPLSRPELQLAVTTGSSFWKGESLSMTSK